MSPATPFRRISVFLSSASTKTQRDPVTNRSPSRISGSPPYEQPTSADDNDDREGPRSASFFSGTSVVSPDSDTVVEQAESSIFDTASIRETSTEIARPAGPRYVYYRVYAENGAIPSANPVYTNDSSLGGIEAKLVAPPHTVSNLKRCLSRIEKINDNIRTCLFLSPSSRKPKSNSDLLSILEYPGPGCSPNEPLALVAALTDGGRSSLEENNPEAILLPRQEGQSPFESHYLYYRVYSNSVAVLAKQPANPNDPSVGRICVDFVPPPHTAASVMRCISKREQLDNSKQSQLFSSIASKSPMDGHIPMLTSSHPGSHLEDPVAFVESTNPTTTSGPVTRKLRVINVSAHATTKQNPGWLILKKGEIISTADDFPKAQSYNWYDGM